MNKNMICLLDMIEIPEPENKLLSHRATKKGIKFTFASKRLPPYVLQLAHHFGYAIEDRTRSGSKGRVILLTDDSGSDRQSWHSDPDHISNS